MATRKLSEPAGTICSKNAGDNQITCDNISNRRGVYERVKRSGIFDPQQIAARCGIPRERISDCVEFDPANAIKFTLYRTRPSGSPVDWDVMSCRRCGPLLDLEAPWD
jgi:hypothetical protein